MGELVIVTGPPGAGKSTVAAALADRREPSVLIEGDWFFRFLRRGRTDPWLAEAHPQNVIVTDAAAAATARFASGPYWTVYDGVVSPWAIKPFISAGVARTHYIVLLPDVEVCVDRVVRRNRHEFRDEAAARHMHAQFAGAAIPARHVVHAPSDDIDTLADEILALVERGSVVVDGDSDGDVAF